MPFDDTLHLATGNLGKFREASTILAQFQIRLDRLKAPKIEIQDENLDKIARFAADEISRKHEGIIAVEDSGLFVESLLGFPGAFTAYTYRTIGPSGILKLMRNSANREAHFETAIAVSQSGRHLKTFVGKVDGSITSAERGTNGFGFDPIFAPLGERRTFAEMRSSEKNTRSHRHKAYGQLGKWFTSSAGQRQLLQTAES